MPDYNLEPTVTAYTTYMDACLRVRPSTVAPQHSRSGCYSAAGIHCCLKATEDPLPEALSSQLMPSFFDDSSPLKYAPPFRPPPGRFKLQGLTRVPHPGRHEGKGSGSDTRHVSSLIV